MVRLGVEFEYYLNLLCELRDLTLWDKIWKNLKKLNKIWFIFEKSIILFRIMLFSISTSYAKGLNKRSLSPCHEFTFWSS